MKKQFTIPVTVTAYTKEEAQANVDLLLQIGAFLKDFNLSNLAGSLVNRFLAAKLGEMTHTYQAKVSKPSSKPQYPIVAICFRQPNGRQSNATNPKTF